MDNRDLFISLPSSSLEKLSSKKMSSTPFRMSSFCYSREHALSVSSKIILGFQIVSAVPR